MVNLPRAGGSDTPSDEEDGSNPESEDGTSSDDGANSDDESDGDCALPEHVDDMEFDTMAAAPLPGEAQRVVETDTVTLICGAGFLASLSASSSNVSSIDIPELGSRCAGLSAAGGHVVMTSARGSLLLAMLSADGKLELVDELSLDVEFSHGVFLEGSKGWVALGRDGVREFSINDSALVLGRIVAGTTDAHDVSPFGENLVVADGEQGIALIDKSGGLLHTITRFGVAQRVIVDGDRVLLLRGAWGYDVFIQRDDRLYLTSPHSQHGTMVDGRFDGDSLYVVTAMNVSRLRVTSDGVAQTRGTELRPEAGGLLAPWLRGITGSGGELAVISDDSFIPLHAADSEPAPDIQSNSTTASIWHSPGENEAMTEVILENTGAVDLVITGTTANAPFTAQLALDDLVPRPGCPGQYTIGSGRKFRLHVYAEAPDAAFVSGTVSVETNDPDTPSLRIPVEANRVPMAAGDELADFALLNTDGELFATELHRGNVLYLKFFNIL